VALDDAVVIQIRAEGGPRAASELRGVEGAVKGLGGAATVAGRGMSNLRQNMALGATAAYAMRRTAYVTGAAVAGMGALAVKSGIQFNATMEQNRVAMGRFLGSTAAARTELGFLYDLAAKTPFETQNITAAAQAFLAVGFGVRQTNSWMRTLGDTIAAIPNAGPQQIGQMTNVLGQIHSKGRLQGDELMQLSELGILNRQDLARRLGVTPEVLMSGNANIPADKALRALQAQFNARYGGMAAAQSKTFSGQVSTLHDNVNMALGSATKPLFNSLRTGVLPALNASGTDINRIFGRHDIDTAEKLTMSRAVLRRRLAPFADELQHQVAAAHIPEHLGDAFGHAAPYIASQAMRSIVPAFRSGASALVHSGPWGMAGAALWLGFKTGAVKGLGSILLGKTGLGGRGSSPANPLFVVTENGGGFGGPGGLARGGRGMRYLRGAGKFAWPLALGLGGAEAIQAAGLNPFHASADNSPAALRQRRARALADARRNGNVGVSRGHFLGEITVVHSHVYLNGKEIAGAVAQEALDAAARKGH
jgi:hypothetical protein